MLVERHIQYVTRKGSFDAGHRVMNERMKCFNVHGHTYLFELVFSFDHMQDIGYNIDFKEIKRVGLSFIDNMLDHAMLLNPHDYDLIEVCEKLGSKMWLMSLHGFGAYCNPTVENIAKEIFMSMQILFLPYPGLIIDKVILYETPNCSTICTYNSITNEERTHFMSTKQGTVQDYSKQIGVVEYDDRKAP